jgi:hypothetical protein
MLPATGERAHTKQQGFTIAMVLADHETSASPGDVVFSHEYMKLSVGSGGGNDTSLKLNFSYFDGFGSNFMSGTSSMCTGLMVNGARSHFVAIIADGGANIVSFVVDGVYCDESWSRIPQTGMSAVPSSKLFQVNSESKAYGGAVEKLEVYDVALRTSEVVAMYRNKMLTI